MTCSFGDVFMESPIGSPIEKRREALGPQPRPLSRPIECAGVFLPISIGNIDSTCRANAAVPRQAFGCGRPQNSPRPSSGWIPLKDRAHFSLSSTFAFAPLPIAISTSQTRFSRLHVPVGLGFSCHPLCGTQQDRTTFRND